jgi:hypothetical protein
MFDTMFWRKPQSLDEMDAENARNALAMCSFYPTGDLNQDPGFEVSEAKERAALHQIVDALDRTDLAAVYTLARVLALVPRDPATFERVAKSSTRALAMAGFGERGPSQGSREDYSAQ